MSNRLAYRTQSFRRAMVGVAVFLVLLPSCSDSKPSHKSIANPPPHLQPATPPAPKISVVQPERNAWHPLELAEQRIFGIHIPTAFVVRHRKPGLAIGECQTIIKEVKAFYQQLDYHVLGQEKGFKIIPSKEVLVKMSKKDRKAASDSSIFIFKGRNRWWTFQIHGPETRLETVTKADPLGYINRPDIETEVEDRGRTKARVVNENLQVTPKRKEPRRYEGNRAIDIRPRLKAWMKANRKSSFSD